MQITDNGRIRWSASDLASATTCEFGFLRNLDVKAGRLEDPGFTPDAMRVRAGELGDVHEQRVLAEYRDAFGDGVVEIPRPGRGKESEAVDATFAAFADGADVVFQATFLDDDGEAAFIGFADFITRQPDGSYRVEDTKLARRAKVTALLQLAAYADQLERRGVPVDGTVTLILGDGRRSDHRLADIAPVFQLRRTRLLQIIAERQSEGGILAWGDERYAICGSCDWCGLEVERISDVLGVANLRLSQRTKLRAHGIETIADLAASTDDIPGIGSSTLATLRSQAELQAQPKVDGKPPVQVVDPTVLVALPPPSPGDMFFDFEGDPLYEEDGVWGMDYLWGWCDTDERFTPIWAHSFVEERQALLTFLETVAERRAQWPDMHVYHYAPYEKTHLLSVADRHGVGAAEVDALLREHVLVDLYPLARKSLRVGSASYSIKKLEPLYLTRTREGVDTAGDSVQAYADACAARDQGNSAEWDRPIQEIADYNEDDVVSTLQLRDYLKGFQEDYGITPVPLVPREEAEPSEARARLNAAQETLAKIDAEGDPDRELLVAMASAATAFHANEGRIFWQSHFSRLVLPMLDWEDERDVFIVERGQVVTDWHLPKGARRRRRRIRVEGHAAPGSRWSESSKPIALFEHPAPFTNINAEPGARSWNDSVTVVGVGEDWLDLQEMLAKGADEYKELPSAIGPGQPPNATILADAIASWSVAVCAPPLANVRNACVDVILRQPPALTSGPLAPVIDDDYTAHVVDSVLRLDHSYLAVQGPPGTGKTYVGSHVIQRLVEDHGWKIGVVSQSHRSVENMLNAIVDKAGLDKSLVGKELQAGDTGGQVSFTALSKGSQPEFALDHPRGFVLGGTAWTFANGNRVSSESLDLLVIDEAGQFSLPNTIASAAAARNLLLLGDPQQLPQVTQAHHDSNVDSSALGWLGEGHDVLPPELGYFLATTRRMHPDLTHAVSRLSYEDQLAAHPTVLGRHLEGVEPGLQPHPVTHAGNTLESAEEAAEVARIVRSVLGARWTEPSTDRVGDPLGEGDIIVITPYNAQVNMVRTALAEAGLPGVRVGTVDKFQGQEAAVCIVTMAASSARDVARGTEFLLNRNRLNVAISRGQWVTFLVHSPGLLDAMPHSPERLVELGRFAGLAASGPTPAD